MGLNLKMVQFTQTLIIQFSRGKCCRMEEKDGGKSNQLYRIYIYFFVFVLSPEKPLILICPYHYTLFYCTLLYCASQILRFCFAFFFLNLFVAALHWTFDQCHFSNSICSLCVSVSCFGNSWTILSFFIIIVFVMGICDLWRYYGNCSGVPWTKST